MNLFSLRRHPPRFPATALAFTRTTGRCWRALVRRCGRWRRWSGSNASLSLPSTSSYARCDWPPHGCAHVLRILLMRSQGRRRLQRLKRPTPPMRTSTRGPRTRRKRRRLKRRQLMRRRKRHRSGRTRDNRKRRRARRRRWWPAVVSAAPARRNERLGRTATCRARPARRAVVGDDQVGVPQRLPSPLLLPSLSLPLCSLPLIQGQWLSLYNRRWPHPPLLPTVSPPLLCLPLKEPREQTPRGEAPLTGRRRLRPPLSYLPPNPPLSSRHRHRLLAMAVMLRPQLQPQTGGCGHRRVSVRLGVHLGGPM